MKKLSILLLFITISVSALAYPISPRPLRKLIIESEFIIWGKVLEVGSIKPDKKNDDFWGRDYALILVEETLQGKIKKDTIRVFFTAGLICPAPGVFYEGEQALAFLDKRKKTNDFEIHALSYGVKHGLDPLEYKLYKDRITEMQDILQSQGREVCNETVVDWLVRCAGQKATRWDAMYELSPQSDFMSFYDQGESISRNIIISTANRKKMFDILLQVDTLSYSDIALADLARGINDAVLLGFMKSQLQRIEETYNWTAGDIMQRIALLTGDSELTELVKKFKDVYFGYTEKDKKETKRILEIFILKMKDIRLKISPEAAGENNA